MSIFDSLFTNQNAQNAANAQIAAINAGKAEATGDIKTGLNTAGNTYATGLAPLNTTFGTTNAGVNQLAALLGFGPNGSAGVQSTLQNMPGYQFQLQQGIDNVDRNQAAMGALNSGNTDKAVADYVNGLTSTNYNNYASQLQPFLTASVNTGSQIAGTNANLGNLQNTDYSTLANLAYGSNVGAGNAQANADLANNAAAKNLFDAIGSGANLGAKLLPFLGA